MNARHPFTKKSLLHALDTAVARYESDESRPGRRVSPRSTGAYKALVDLVTVPSERYLPHVTDEGEIIVRYATVLRGRKTDALIIFHVDGEMTLACLGQSNRHEGMDIDRLREFVYLTS